MFHGIHKMQIGLLATPLLRVILGVNIAVHGLSRILAGPSMFAHALAAKFAPTPLSPRTVIAFALSLPWVEAAVGTLVLFGLASRTAYSIGMLVIAALTFGATLTQDWDAAGLQLIYALIYTVLLATCSNNCYSVDRWMAKTTPGGVAA